MSREVPVNVQVVDQFPVWAWDGFTKVSGVTDFLVMVYHNGVFQMGHAVSISEIGTMGEYRVTFTPNATGFWLVEIRNGFNLETWSEEYDVVKPVLLGVV